MTQETTNRPRRAALLVTVAVAAAGLGVAAGAIWGPWSDRSPQAATPEPSIAASSQRDLNGEDACKDLESLYDKPIEQTTHLGSLGNIVIIAVRSTNEQVREEAELLRDALTFSSDEDPTDVWLRVEKQALDLIGACDNADYAF